MKLIGMPLLLSVLLAAEPPPTPKLPLGKETTYVTGPLDKEGYIDYEAALNDRLGKGVTPEKNANVLIWKALGPKPEGAKLPAEFFKRLGYEPPLTGDYFIEFFVYLREHRKLDPDEVTAVDDQLSRAGQRPWTAKDYPHLAAWLKANEKPLAVIIEATRRPDYFNPLISPRTENKPGSLLGALLPSVQMCRELARALAARALLQVGEGKFDEAWQDLLACHRLGLVVARGGTLIEALVGVTLDQTTNAADLAYVERARLTPAQVRDRLKELQGLPPLPSVADKVDLAQRRMHLETVQSIRRGDDAKMEKVLAVIDWEPALRNSNRWYDRLVAALRLKDRAARQKEVDKIDEDLRELRKATGEPENLRKLLEGKNLLDKTIGKAIGDVLIALLLPATQKVYDNADRAEQLQRNLRVAFALAAYQREHGRYPMKLDELAPKYLAAVPGDLFSGKALVYCPSDKGYLLYSVGVNGVDEEGRSFDDDPPGDDLRVRMPLPELKAKE